MARPGTHPLGRGDGSGTRAGPGRRSPRTSVPPAHARAMQKSSSRTIRNVRSRPAAEPRRAAASGYPSPLREATLSGPGRRGRAPRRRRSFSRARAPDTSGRDRAPCRHRPPRAVSPPPSRTATATGAPRGTELRVAVELADSGAFGADRRETAPSYPPDPQPEPEPDPPPLTDQRSGPRVRETPLLSGETIVFALAIVPGNLLAGPRACGVPPACMRRAASGLVSMADRIG
jgi:hypothetical protein